MGSQLGGFICFILKNFGNLHIDYLYEIPAEELEQFNIYYIIIVILSYVFGKRASCYYICWVSPFMILGRKLGKLLKVSTLILQPNSQSYSECDQCNKVCGMWLDIKYIVKSDNMGNAECMLCGECVRMCAY